MAAMSAAEIYDAWYVDQPGEHDRRRRMAFLCGFLEACLAAEMALLDGRGRADVLAMLAARQQECFLLLSGKP